MGKFGPRPLIETLVPFRGSFQNCRRARPSFYRGVPQELDVQFSPNESRVNYDFYDLFSRHLT